MARVIEGYIEHADQLAPRVVHLWGPCAPAGREDAPRRTCLVLFEKACQYRQEILDAFRAVALR